MRFRLAVVSFLLVAALVFLPGPPVSQAGARERAHPAAPDGRRGLGADATLRDLLRLLRSSGEEDEAFFSDLRALEPDVRRRLGELERSYRSAGSFDLVGARSEASLRELHEAFRRSEERPLEALARGGPAAEAFAGLFLDPRFRARMEALEGWELEAGELRRGLAVLAAAVDGYVVLGEAEARAIAVRVDLSASLLRAIRSDLDVLRPTGEAGRPRRAPAARELLARAAAAAQGASGDEALRAALEGMRAEARALAAQMASTLFTARLRPRLAEALARRGRELEQAARAREEALVWLPDSEEGAEAPGDVRRLPRHERMRWAALRGREGLAIDPLDEDLAWAAAHSADFLHGAIESRPLYDRFLALRGLRAHDHRTLRDRDLTEREEEALAVVQRPLMPGDRAGR